MIVRNNDEKLTRAEFEKVLKVILIILKKWNILIHKLIFRAWWTIPWSAACWRCFKLQTQGSSHPTCANTCWCNGLFPLKSSSPRNPLLVLIVHCAAMPPCSVPKWKKANEPTGADAPWTASSQRASGWLFSFWYRTLNRAGRQLQKPSCMLFQVKTIDALLATF